ncbi:VanW family protein [Nostocoides sp.]|uniref:VanW family protein n=1 Tax=Nostocoides sp. TaxID=1917966 RepID=UPI002B6F07D8|nr:VanW family protein [Tetrasphaera sp.]
MTTTSGTTAVPPTGSGRRRRWPWVLATLGVLGAAGYTALALSAGSTTPADTVVGGVQVGGLTHAEALAALRTGLQDKAAAPIPITFADQSIQLDPAVAGLDVDYVKSLDGLTGATFHPVALYERLTGALERDPALRIDTTALRQQLTLATQSIAIKPVNATLVFTDATAVLTPAVDGSTADIPGTMAALEGSWLKASPITGAVAVAEPDITTEEAQQARTELADTIVSGPVAITVNGKSFKVSAASLAPLVTFEPVEGALEARFDEDQLIATVRRAGTKAKVLTAGRDAVVTSSEGKFRVTPSVDGLDIVVAGTAQAIQKAALSTERAVTVASKATPAKFTTAEAKASLPTGVISTFTTYFPYAVDRTHNITLAARALNGTYVAPGETFSLNAHLGERTAAKGYRAAPVIYNGRLTKDYGGGISQVSTTLFNAIFFSGARIDQYTPHSFYISRYPEGREATISWPNVDNRFTNTTKGGILITTNVTSSSITVTFQGKKTWDIEATKGPRVNLTSPREIRDDSEGCVPQSKQDGFDVTVGRIFKQGGKVVKTEYLTTHYIPEDLVICTNPNAG